MKKLSFKLDFAIYIRMFTSFDVQDFFFFLLKHAAVSFSHDTVRARSKSFPQTQTTYVFISCLKLKHESWKFGTIKVWKVTSLKLT